MFNFDKVQFIFSFIACDLGVIFKTSSHNPMSHGFIPVSNSFISLIYFNLIFVYDLG